MTPESVDIRKLAQNVEALVDRHEEDRIPELLDGVHPADIAEISERLDAEDQKALFENLDVEVASDVLPEIYEDAQEDLLEHLEAEQLSGILGEMEDDEIVDLLDGLEVAKQEKILALFDPEDDLNLRRLLEYPEDTAGGRMTTSFIALHQDQTVRDAIRAIRAAVEEAEDYNFIYVVDSAKRLVGLVSMVDLILHKRGTTLKTIMEPDPIRVTTDQDQEDVANIAKKYNLPVVPVVDAAGRLVGRITLDDILEVLAEEAAEDISFLAGTHEDEEAHRSMIRIAGVRLPWLVLGLFGEILAAMVMSRFESTLETILSLAFFIPVIIALGGSTGMQSTAIVIRDLATGEITLRDTLPRVLREIGIGIINGIACGLLIMLVAYLWQGNPRLGVVIGLAMLAVVVIASSVGAIVPLLLKRFNVDPAIATGPFVTTSNDVLGIFIYLGLATLFMRWL